MSRYTGPKARVARRLGTNIWGTKGEAVALDKRPYPPGEHGRTRRRGNVSEYLIQLQKAEGSLHIRSYRASIPQPVQGSEPQAGRDRREHAAVLGTAVGQFGVPSRLGSYSLTGSPVREPRPH